MICYTFYCHSLNIKKQGNYVYKILYKKVVLSYVVFMLQTRKFISVAQLCPTLCDTSLFSNFYLCVLKPGQPYLAQNNVPLWDNSTWLFFWMLDIRDFSSWKSQRKQKQAAPLCKRKFSVYHRTILDAKSLSRKLK